MMLALTGLGLSSMFGVNMLAGKTLFYRPPIINMPIKESRTT